MATFLTALVWGLGVSVGASLGLMVFVLLFALSKPLMDTKAAKAAREVHELSLAALNRRNELTEEQIATLRRIAETMEEANA